MPELNRSQAIASAKKVIQQEIDTLQALRERLGDEFWQCARLLCDKYDILLIYDEVQSGFCRLGVMFASELYETVPDILCFGKALGGGFPIAGHMSYNGVTPFKPADSRRKASSVPFCSAMPSTPGWITWSGSSRLL